MDIFVTSRARGDVKVTITAQRLILLYWKSEASQHLKLEKLGLTIHGSSANSDRIWKPFIEYIRAKL